MPWDPYVGTGQQINWNQPYYPNPQLAATDVQINPPQAQQQAPASQSLLGQPNPYIFGWPQSGVASGANGATASPAGNNLPFPLVSGIPQTSGLDVGALISQLMGSQNAPGSTLSGQLGSGANRYGGSIQSNVGIQAGEAVPTAQVGQLAGGLYNNSMAAMQSANPYLNQLAREYGMGTATDVQRLGQDAMSPIALGNSLNLRDAAAQANAQHQLASQTARSNAGLQSGQMGVSRVASQLSNEAGVRNNLLQLLNSILGLA